MKLTVYQIDAFARKVFEGNPAAVVALETMLPDLTMRAIAGEHNLSETAFIVRAGVPGRWRIRWFTPTTEVEMCGHATLAAGALVLREFEPQLTEVTFESKIGDMLVRRREEGFVLTLDAKTPEPWSDVGVVAEMLRIPIVDSFKGRYAHVVVDDVTALCAMDASDGVAAASMVSDANPRHLGVTARGGRETDFILRFFAPGVGILEDPVTGSAFSDLAPYWTKKLGKPELLAYQASPRGGYVSCRYDGGDIVKIAGGAVEYSRAQIRI